MVKLLLGVLARHLVFIVVAFVLFSFVYELVSEGRLVLDEVHDIVVQQELKVKGNE